MSFRIPAELQTFEREPRVRISLLISTSGSQPKEIAINVSHAMFMDAAEPLDFGSDKSGDAFVRMVNSAHGRDYGDHRKRVQEARKNLADAVSKALVNYLGERDTRNGYPKEPT